MLYRLPQSRWFTFCVLVFCVIYLIFEFVNNQYTTWSIDDFWFTHGIYTFSSNLPYRDFSPYKTVLGYYFLLPLVAMGHHTLNVILHTKNFIALLNAGLFGITAFWLKRFFSKTAIVATLALLMFSVVILNYSTNIRVDFLAYWLCLFSTLFLFEDKFILAGLTIGIAFLTSQKALWYIAANDIALGVYWLLAARNKKIFWGTFKFNITTIITILLYILFWSYWAGFNTVMNNMFYEAYAMFQLDIYNCTRKLFWGFTLTNNPFIFLLWPLALLTLFVQPQQDVLHGKRIFIVAYTFVILFCLIPYKQVFPYYMLTAVPAFILLYAAFFTWLDCLFKEKTLPKLYIFDKDGIWALTFLYIFSFLYTAIIFVLPEIFLFFILIPILLAVKITETPSTLYALIRCPLPYIIFLTIIFAFIYPLFELGYHFREYSRGYQKSMIQLTEALTQDGSDYVAGIELIYNKNQQVQGMRHLDAGALAYLFHPTESSRKAMLASLYRSPDITTEKVIENLKASSVKFYVNNYRMDALPPSIKHYLQQNYAHFWGSIYLYAPLIQPNQKNIYLKVAGKYQVIANGVIELDGKMVEPNTMIRLPQGKHISQSKQPYRLKLYEENVNLLLNPQYEKDNWQLMFI